MTTKIKAGVIGDGVVGTSAIADDAITSAKLDTNIAVAGTLTVTGDANFDSNTLFVDASANNVGIGTSSPQSWAKLEVAGSAGAQDGAKQALYIRAPSTTANEGVGIRMSAASGSNEAVGIIGMVNNATGNAGSMTFHTYNLGATIDEQMRIDNNGNVGIGTNDPGAKLDIRMSDSNGAYGRGLAGNLNLENTNTSVTEGGWLSISGYMGNATSRYQMGAITGGKQTTAADGDYGSYLSFWNTSGGANGESNSAMYERMRIDSSGRVGIGVTPTHNFNLQSAGTVEARFRSTDADCRLQISSDTDEGQDSILEFLSGTSTRGSIAYDHNPTATSQNMLFKTGDNAVTAMRIDGSGRVGINRTPAIANSKLEVGGADNVPLINVEASGTTGGMGVGSSKVQIYHGTSAKLFLTADGSLGVNESVPTGKIHVRDNNFSGYMGVFSQGGSGGANHGMYIETASGSSYLMIQRVSGSTKHYVTGSGNYYFAGTNVSDLNKKENISDISNGLNVVNNLRPRTFNFKDNSTVDKAGFIAQEAQIVEPRLVSGNEFDETQTDEEGSNPTGLGFDYMGYTAYLTKAIQEQQTIIDDLKSRLDSAGL